jgi:hypothetical protein
LEGGAISGRGRIENGGVTMMPGADGAVSVAGVAPGSVSAQRRSTEKKQPSATAATTVNSLFIQPISLRAVSLYSDPTDATRELPCRVARLTQKDVFCLAPLVQAVYGRREKKTVDSASSQSKACFAKGCYTVNRLAFVDPTTNPPGTIRLGQSAGPPSPVCHRGSQDIATKTPRSCAPRSLIRAMTGDRYIEFPALGSRAADGALLANLDTIATATKPTTPTTMGVVWVKARQFAPP